MPSTSLLPQGPDFGEWTASKQARAGDGIALRRQGSSLQIRFVRAARESDSQDSDLQAAGNAAGRADTGHEPDEGGGANSGGANSRGNLQAGPGADAALEEGQTGSAAGAAAAAKAVGEPAAAQRVGKLWPEGQCARQHSLGEDAELRDKQERQQQRHGWPEHASRKRQRADALPEAAARATSGGAAAAAAAGAAEPEAAAGATHSAIAAHLAVGGAGGTGQAAAAAAAGAGGTAWAEGQAAAAPLPAAGAALEPKPPGKMHQTNRCLGPTAASVQEQCTCMFVELFSDRRCHSRMR